MKHIQEMTVKQSVLFLKVQTFHTFFVGYVNFHKLTKFFKFFYIFRKKNFTK